MTEREQIENRKKELRLKIGTIEEELRELTIKGLLLCDDQQHYTEEVVERVYMTKPRRTTNVLIGKIHWKEEIQDEDRPDNPITVDRSRVVRIAGNWL